MKKIEFRDVVALLALGLVVLAMALEASGHPVPEWLKQPIATIFSVVLGFYFVDSVKRAGAAPAPAEATPSAPKAAASAEPSAP